jgi:hypothetical protein
MKNISILACFVAATHLCAMDQQKLSVLSGTDLRELQRNGLRQKEVLVPDEAALLSLFDTNTLCALIEKNSGTLAAIQKLAGKKHTVQSLIDESAQIVNQYRRQEKNPYESGAMAKRTNAILKILLHNEPKIYEVILEERDAYLSYDSVNENWD